MSTLLRETPLEKIKIGSIKFKSPILSNFKITTISKILAFLLLGLIAVIFQMVFSYKSNLSKLVTQDPNKIEAEVDAKLPTNFLSLDEYMKQVQQRDIFHPIPPPAPPTPVVQQPEAPPKPSLNELMKDLKLTGIYFGADSEIIVENKATKEILYLKEGDVINTMTIKSILKDRAIMQEGDRQAELI